MLILCFDNKKDVNSFEEYTFLGVAVEYKEESLGHTKRKIKG